MRATTVEDAVRTRERANAICMVRDAVGAAQGTKIMLKRIQTFIMSDSGTGWKDGECWYDRAPGTGTGLRNSRAIIISRRTGEVIYDGSANDEG